MKARCNCWLGEHGATCGSSEVRMRCPVHGDHVAPVTPPTPEQITALEQWARDLKYMSIIRPSVSDLLYRADAILALCETVRAQQAELTKWQTCSGCGEKMDAPGHCTNAETEWIKGQLANLEQAHDERDDARQHVEMLEKSLASLSQQREEAHQSALDWKGTWEQTQDRLNAALADLAKLRAAVEALHDYETTGAPDYHEWDRYFDAVYAAAQHRDA